MRATSVALLASLSSVISTAQAVTIYGQMPLAQTMSVAGTGSAQVAQPTYAAYDQTVLVPPQVPNPAPATAYTLSLQRDATAVNGLSIPHVGGSFWGFSVEMSVINQVCELCQSVYLHYEYSMLHLFSGEELVRFQRAYMYLRYCLIDSSHISSFLMVPFLNLMANLQERAGSVSIRLGGNTQEFATQVDSLPEGHTFGKEDSGSTQTVCIIFYEFSSMIFKRSFIRRKRLRYFIPLTCFIWWRTFRLC